ncbi:MAG: hypothetical protein ACK5Y2_12650 [Bdellovibrionales bacterium]
MGFISACSIDSSLKGLNPIDALNPFEKPRAAEIVSGSAQYRLTQNNYQVSASAGNVYDKLQGTTSSGYQVYITVQGQMLSEEQ